jgi:hypothetical protein
MLRRRGSRESGQDVVAPGSAFAAPDVVFADVDANAVIATAATAGRVLDLDRRLNRRRRSQPYQVWPSSPD